MKIFKEWWIWGSEDYEMEVGIFFSLVISIISFIEHGHFFLTFLFENLNWKHV